ncbi:MAG TPA: tetratricopeptide repeat protein [Xanthobacteraceae bacterium]|jgi:predicted O-linked N-acetylglucosamine transferase (SPINDLY family)
MKFQQAIEQAAALHRAGQLAQAEQAYRQILKVDPDHADSLHLLGVIAHQTGHSDKAVELIGRAIRLNNQSADFHSNIGTAFHALGRLDEALSHYTRALDLDPDHLDARNNLGNALFKRGAVVEATSHFARAVTARPHDADAHFNLGNALLVQGRIQDAIARYQRALVLKPHWAEAHYNLGRALSFLGRVDEAKAQFRRALDIRPDYVEAYSQLAAALHKTGHVGEAEACCRQALAIRPDDADSLNVLASTLLSLGRIEEAIVTFGRAVADRPDDATVHSNLIFALNFAPAATTADQQAERAAWAERHANRVAAGGLQHGNDPSPHRRLRIGYVSSHFRRQAATYAFGGVIINHDPSEFEVICYSDTDLEDEVTRCLAARADRWHRTARLDDGALANLIGADRIDILVDLVGHMRGHRLLVFARKPAPVAVTAWGEPNGTGLPTMDYLLADRVLVPAEDRALLAEEVIELPNFLGLWLPPDFHPAQPRALPARSRGHITFGSFNRLEKIQQPVLTRWAAILSRVRGSRLVLKERTLCDSAQRNRILAILGANGVSAERVTLLPWHNPTEQFEMYQNIDLALDPFPHSGAMTTLEALWMGVPVVTCAGRTIPSRLSAASLTALDLTDFIAGDLDTYVELAVAKARDLDSLTRLRAGLRQRIADSEFGNPVRYTRAVEAAYRRIWQRWCAERGETHLRQFPDRKLGPSGGDFDRPAKDRLARSAC